MDTDKVDAMIEAAKARMKVSGNTPVGAIAAPEGPKAPRVRLTDAERKARDSVREKDRAEKQILRAAKKAARAAEQSLKTPHMNKLSRAAAALPGLSSKSAAILEEITGSCSSEETFALSEHLQHLTRA